MGNIATIQERVAEAIKGLTPEELQEVREFAWALVHDPDKADRLRKEYKAQGFNPTRRNLNCNQISAT